MCADGWRDQTCGLFEAKAEKELRHHFFPPLPLKEDIQGVPKKMSDSDFLVIAASAA